jgi:Multicopper oxidase
MTIIEVEGVLVKPLVVNSIQVLARKRYYFIVRASMDIYRS